MEEFEWFLIGVVVANVGAAILGTVRGLYCHPDPNWRQPENAQCGCPGCENLPCGCCIRFFGRFKADGTFELGNVRKLLRNIFLQWEVSALFCCCWAIYEFEKWRDTYFAFVVFILVFERIVSTVYLFFLDVESKKWSPTKRLLRLAWGLFCKCFGLRGCKEVYKSCLDSQDETFHLEQMAKVQATMLSFVALVTVMMFSLRELSHKTTYALAYAAGILSAINMARMANYEDQLGLIERKLKWNVLLILWRATQIFFFNIVISACAAFFNAMATYIVFGVCILISWVYALKLSPEKESFPSWFTDLLEHPWKFLCDMFKCDIDCWDSKRHENSNRRSGCCELSLNALNKVILVDFSFTERRSSFLSNRLWFFQIILYLSLIILKGTGLLGLTSTSDAAGFHEFDVKGMRSIIFLWAFPAFILNWLFLLIMYCTRIYDIKKYNAALNTEIQSLIKNKRWDLIFKLVQRKRIKHLTAAQNYHIQKYSSGFRLSKLCVRQKNLKIQDLWKLKFGMKELFNHRDMRWNMISDHIDTKLKEKGLKITDTLQDWKPLQEFVTQMCEVTLTYDIKLEGLKDFKLTAGNALKKFQETILKRKEQKCHRFINYDNWACWSRPLSQKKDKATCSLKEADTIRFTVTFTYHDVDKAKQDLIDHTNKSYTDKKKEWFWATNLNMEEKDVLKMGNKERIKKICNDCKSSKENQDDKGKAYVGDLPDKRFNNIDAGYYDFWAIANSPGVGGFEEDIQESPINNEVKQGQEEARWEKLIRDCSIPIKFSTGPVENMRINSHEDIELFVKTMWEHGTYVRLYILEHKHGEYGDKDHEDFEEIEVEEDKICLKRIKNFQLVEKRVSRDAPNLEFNFKKQQRKIIFHKDDFVLNLNESSDQESSDGKCVDQEAIDPWSCKVYRIKEILEDGTYAGVRYRINEIWGAVSDSVKAWNVHDQELDQIVIIILDYNAYIPYEKELTSCQGVRHRHQFEVLHILLLPGIDNESFFKTKKLYERDRDPKAQSERSREDHFIGIKLEEDLLDEYVTTSFGDGVLKYKEGNLLGVDLPFGTVYYTEEKELSRLESGAEIQIMAKVLKNKKLMDQIKLFNGKSVKKDKETMDRILGELGLFKGIVLEPWKEKAVLKKKMKLLNNMASFVLTYPDQKEETIKPNEDEIEENPEEKDEFTESFCIYFCSALCIFMQVYLCFPCDLCMFCQTQRVCCQGGDQKTVKSVLGGESVKVKSHFGRDSVASVELITKEKHSDEQQSDEEHSEELKRSPDQSTLHEPLDYNSFSNSTKEIKSESKKQSQKAETGDIFLYSQRTLYSNCKQLLLEGGPYTHCGIIYVDKKGVVYVIEENAPHNQTTYYDLSKNNLKKTKITEYFSEVMKETLYGDVISIRKVLGYDKSETTVEERLKDFCNQRQEENRGRDCRCYERSAPFVRSWLESEFPDEVQKFIKQECVASDFGDKRAGCVCSPNHFLRCPVSFLCFGFFAYIPTRLHCCDKESKTARDKIFGRILTIEYSSIIKWLELENLESTKDNELCDQPSEIYESFETVNDIRKPPSFYINSRVTVRQSITKREGLTQNAIDEIFFNDNKFVKKHGPESFEIKRIFNRGEILDLEVDDKNVIVKETSKVQIGWKIIAVKIRHIDYTSTSELANVSDYKETKRKNIKRYLYLKPSVDEIEITFKEGHKAYANRGDSGILLGPPKLVGKTYYYPIMLEELERTEDYQRTPLHTVALREHEFASAADLLAYAKPKCGNFFVLYLFLFILTITTAGMGLFAYSRIQEKRMRFESGMYEKKKKRSWLGNYCKDRLEYILLAFSYCVGFFISMIININFLKIEIHQFYTIVGIFYGLHLFACFEKICPCGRDKEIKVELRTDISNFLEVNQRLNHFHIRKTYSMGNDVAMPDIRVDDQITHFRTIDMKGNTTKPTKHSTCCISLSSKVSHLLRLMCKSCQSEQSKEGNYEQESKEGNDEQESKEDNNEQSSVEMVPLNNDRSYGSKLFLHLPQKRASDGLNDKQLAQICERAWRLKTSEPVGEAEADEDSIVVITDSDDDEGKSKRRQEKRAQFLAAQEETSQKNIAKDQSENSQDEDSIKFKVVEEPKLKKKIKEVKYVIESYHDDINLERIEPKVYEICESLVKEEECGTRCGTWCGQLFDSCCSCCAESKEYVDPVNKWEVLEDMNQLDIWLPSASEIRPIMMKIKRKGCNPYKAFYKLFYGYVGVATNEVFRITEIDSVKLPFIMFVSIFTSGFVYAITSSIDLNTSTDIFYFVGAVISLFLSFYRAVRYTVQSVITVDKSVMEYVVPYSGFAVQKIRTVTTDIRELTTTSSHSTSYARRR